MDLMLAKVKKYFLADKRRIISGGLILAMLLLTGWVVYKTRFSASTNLPPAETFDSHNAIYDGDFEDSTPRGWASNDIIRGLNTALGWSHVNGLNRDAHSGRFAFSTSSEGYYSYLSQKLDFDPAGQEVTLSCYMKGNSGTNAAKRGQIILKYLIPDGPDADSNKDENSITIQSGQDGQPDLTDQYQKFEKTFTFPSNMELYDIKGNNFQLRFYPATGSINVENPDGSSLYYDDLLLTFTSHPIVKQIKLTTDTVHSFVPDSPSSNKIRCPGASSLVDFTYPNCFTKNEELSAVYVRLTVLPGSPNLTFRVSGKMNSYIIPTRFISFFPNYLLADPGNSNIVLAPGSSSESSSWLKVSYPYIYLNALDDSLAVAKTTTSKSLISFKAMNNGVETGTAKFKIEIASDSDGTHILKSRNVDGNSSEIVFIPRHLPASGDGINFADEEANLDEQEESLHLDSSDNQASKLNEVPFMTGNALGKNLLGDALYNLQTNFLRKLGINGVSINKIQGPQLITEKQQEAENKGFTNNASITVINTDFSGSEFDFPLDQVKIDKTIKSFRDRFTGYDTAKMKNTFILEEPEGRLKSIVNYVSSPVAQSSFRRYLESLGLKPQNFDANFTAWDSVNMVLSQDAKNSTTSSKEWYYTAKFRSESLTRFTSAVSDGLKTVLPNASLVAGFSDSYQRTGNVIQMGNFWPSYARNSKLNSMPTGFVANEEVSTMVSSYSSAIMRSGLANNNYNLTALINLQSSWTADDIKLQIYSSFLSGAKEYWMFNYGPSYLPEVTDSSSTKSDKMKVINDVANDFVGVQSEIKNSTKEKAQTAILYSQTADSWQWANDAKANITSNATLDREREGLFMALENKQIPTDVVSEENIDLDNALSQYKVLYMVGANIPAATQTKIAEWVKAGGRLYVSMGAGSKDEFNQDSEIISEVLGVKYSGLNIISYPNSALPNAVCTKGSQLNVLQNYKIFKYGTNNLYGQCMQADQISTLDSNTQIIAQGKSTLVIAGKEGNISIGSEPLLTRHQFGSGTAYYSNFLAGVSYEYKASVQWNADHPIKDSAGNYIIDPATGGVIIYPQSSFTKYPGDAEQNLIIAPVISSGIVRKVEIKDATTNELMRQVQTSVLSGYHTGLSYSLIPIANFNQQDKIVKIKLNIDPTKIASIKSVEKGDLAFKNVNGQTVINSLGLNLTDIVQVNYIGMQPPPPPHITNYSINIEEGQVITTNPYIISLSAKDPADTLKISKLEFYVDNNLIGTTTLPDVSGAYQAVWDTSKYHSAVKVLVYGTDGTTQEIDRNTTVSLTTTTTAPDQIITTLPNTGESENSWIRIVNKAKNLIQSILGL